MDILVLHTSFVLKDRKTITDSLYCFRRYVHGHRFFYLDVQKPRDVAPWVFNHPFDGVIMHYTLFANRYNTAVWPGLKQALCVALAGSAAAKVMVPQDEYNYTDELRSFARQAGVGHILTCAKPIDYDMLYPPEATGGAVCSTVYTGYIDARSLRWIDRMARRVKTRPVDIGYRASNLPYWVGRHGQLKAQVAERFTEKLRDYPQLKTDIGTVDRMGGNVLMGNSWTEFLLSCRTMPGCLGGTGLLDADGSIAARVNSYVAQHPDAGFDEVEAACFPGQDGRLHMYALSPRHFECAMTKTCQLLVEGDYYGVFLPGVHYIEVKRDFSNLDEVLRQVQDHALCEGIAQRCYDDVVAKGGADNPNTYAWYADHVVGVLQEATVQHKAAGRAGGALILAALWLRRRCLWFAWRMRIFAKRLRDGFVNAYFALCNFSERHPALQKVLRVFTRRRQTDDQGQNESHV